LRGAVRGGSGEDVLFAWPQTIIATTNTDIIIRAWQTVDGAGGSLGGGCGTGGTYHATCARSPNRLFAHRLRDSIPGMPAAFILSTVQLGLPCGPCTLVPDPGSGIVLAMSTSAGGDASVPFGIPSSSPLRGVAFFGQWATFDCRRQPARCCPSTCRTRCASSSSEP
jgi:hypothetical protein